MPETKHDRMKEHFATDFLPALGVSAENRIANAAEYAAHHLGRISRNLETLIELLQKDKKLDGGKF